MRSRLGLTSYAYYRASQAVGPDGAPAIAPWSLLDKVTELGLEVLQICENVPLAGLDASTLGRFRDDAERRGVILEVGTNGLDPDYLRSQLEITRVLGAHLLRIVPWGGAESQHRLSVDDLCDVIGRLMPLCRDHDITLGIENHFDLRDEDLVALVRRLDDERVGICLDTANSTGLLQKPIETAELLAPYVVSLHLKDFVITKVAGTGYRISGVPLGQGWLDAAMILDAVSRTGRQTNVLLELWMEPEESVQATLAKEEEWVRRSVAYAREKLDLGDTPRTASTQ